MKKIVLIFFWIVMMVACKPDVRTFADTLRGGNPHVVVSQAKHYLDSIADVNPQIFVQEHRQITDVLMEEGMKQQAMEMAVYPFGIDHRERPDIAERLVTSLTLPGKKAPAVENIDFSKSKYTLLFFYESTCRTCQAMISDMTERYDELRHAGVRVVVISSDPTQERFEEYARKFPWEDKICDLKGYGSPYFVNYGVANTPTIFLVNRKGMVVDEYPSPEQVYQKVFEDS